VSEPQTEKGTGRVEAFSDGVFAIAITLLILDLKVPDLETLSDPNHALLAYLAGQWRSYIAYVMSFAVILVMWVNHHRIFIVVRKTDHAFLFWNGLLLMMVSIVPFPTALLAKYFIGSTARTAAAVYAGHGLLVALAFQGVWRHATGNDRLIAPGCQAEVARLTAQYRFGPLMYLIAFVLAFVSAWTSIGLCLAFAVFFAFQGFSQKADA